MQSLESLCAELGASTWQILIGLLTGLQNPSNFPWDVCQSCSRTRIRTQKLFALKTYLSPMAMPTLSKAWHNFVKAVVPGIDIATTRKKKILIKDSIAGHLADTLIWFLLGQFLTDSTLLECYFLITEHVFPSHHPSPKHIHRTFNEREKGGMSLLRFDQWFDRSKNHTITETQSLLNMLNLFLQKEILLIFQSSVKPFTH